ncbi:hypothetical protein [Ferrimonas balearica]|uniref:hypothetical protein n=1 Tax=Ferrimonas balearica TaxID=44012 RepID=UPI001C9A25F8|nr:hypothetical protein [Ferrimonas balearica]MBY5991795.1 hypothetical protein [Ferrimonas balearica]
MRGVMWGLCLMALPVLAEPQIQSLTLDAQGQVSTQGRLSGYELVEYRITLQKGTPLSVSLESDNRFQYFNITGPNQDSALFVGSVEGTEFSGQVAMDGEYRILTYLMRNAARRDEVGRYTLSVRQPDYAPEPNLPDP